MATRGALHYPAAITENPFLTPIFPMKCKLLNFFQRMLIKFIEIVAIYSHRSDGLLFYLWK